MLPGTWPLLGMSSQACSGAEPLAPSRSLLCVPPCAQVGTPSNTVLPETAWRNTSVLKNEDLYGLTQR